MLLYIKISGFTKILSYNMYFEILNKISQVHFFRHLLFIDCISELTFLYEVTFFFFGKEEMSSEKIISKDRNLEGQNRHSLRH